MILTTVSKFKFDVMDAFHEILKADKKIRGACRSGADLTNLAFSKKKYIPNPRKIVCMYSHRGKPNCFPIL